MTHSTEEKSHAKQTSSSVPYALTMADTSARGRKAKAKYGAAAKERKEQKKPPTIPHKAVEISYQRSKASA